MADSEKPLVQQQEEYELGCCDKFATTTGLCCFMSADEYKHNPLAEVVQNNQRRCTDLPCCIVLLLCIISEIILVIYASENGASPKLLMHGYDARMSYLGNTYSSAQLCDSSNSQGSYAVWPDIDSPNIRICAPNCDFTSDASNEYIAGSQDGAMKELYTSTAFMDAYCLPTGAVDIPSSFDSSTESYERAISDLQTAAWLIFIMSFVSILIAFIYLKMISFIGRLLIMFTIICVSVGGILLSFLLIQNGLEAMKDSETETIGKVELGTGIVFSVLLICLVLALWFMRKNIELVIEMLNEASYAIRDMKFTLIFPIFVCFAAIGFMAIWVVEALFIYSVKEQETPNWPNEFFETNPFYAGGSYFNLEFDSAMQDSLS